MNTRILAAVAASLFLTACGGGDGGGPVSSSDAADAGAVTDGLVPLEISSSEIAARLSTILDQADTYLLTNLVDTEFFFVGNISTICRAGTCQTSEGESTLDYLTVDDNTEYGPAATLNGIAIYAGLNTIEEADDITTQIWYGAWLDYSAFSTYVESFEFIEDGYFEEFVAGISIGDDSGSRPVGGSATWTGVMTGEDLEFNDFVQGDAAVTVNFARNNAGVAFTNIIDVDTLSDLPSMEWSGLSIGADGRFVASDIKATFYGPNHEEVGGIFQRNLIVGAFGAKRQ